METPDMMDATMMDDTMPMEQVEMEMKDMEYEYSKGQMLTANIIWNLLAATMATKKIMKAMDADYSGFTFDGKDFYQYGDMILNYSGAAFYTVASILQLVSMFSVAVDINMMFLMHGSMIYMALQGIAELLIFYAYDKGHTAGSAEIETIDMAMAYYTAGEAWLGVTKKALYPMWKEGQYAMMSAEMQMAYKEKMEMKDKKAYERNMEMMYGKVEEDEEPAADEDIVDDDTEELIRF